MTHIDGAKLLDWLERNRYMFIGLLEYKMLKKEIESGTFDLLPTEVTCKTCKGSKLVGWVTGSTPEDYSEHTEPCPDCTDVDARKIEDEREYIASQFRRIEGCVVPGLANVIASETLKEIGEDTYVETHSTAT